MDRLKYLSVVASSMLVFTACGSSGKGGSSDNNTLTPQAVDGYVIKLSEPAKLICDGKVVATTDTVGERGRITQLVVKYKFQNHG